MQKFTALASKFNKVIEVKIRKTYKIMRVSILIQYFLMLPLLIETFFSRHFRLKLFQLDRGGEYESVELKLPNLVMPPAGFADDKVSERILFYSMAQSIFLEIFGYIF